MAKTTSIDIRKAALRVLQALQQMVARCFFNERFIPGLKRLPPDSVTAFTNAIVDGSLVSIRAFNEFLERSKKYADDLNCVEPSDINFASIRRFAPSWIGSGSGVSRSLTSRFKQPFYFLLPLLARSYIKALMQRKDLSAPARCRPKRKTPKMITLSPYARILVTRAAEVTAMSHSGLIEHLIRTHCQQMIAAEKAFLTSS